MQVNTWGLVNVWSASEVAARYVSEGTVVNVCSTAPSAYTLLAYKALEYTELGLVVDVGAIGVTFEDVVSDDLGSRDKDSTKGARTWTETPITVDSNYSDAGQEIIDDHYNGENLDNPVSFEVIHPSGLTQYFSALIFDFSGESMSQDTVYRTSASIKIKSGSYVTEKA